MAAYEYWRVRVQFTAGVWTDVTADVDTMAAPIRATTGATAETTGEPASLSLVLHNPGFKYTPGSGSPTALATGQPIQYYEIIADQVVYLFTGFVEFPEIDSVNLSMTQTQGIAVSAIDQLSAWERSPTFVSTLAAHILANAGGDLRGLWTFADLGLVQRDVSPAGAGPVTIGPLVHLPGPVTGDVFTPQGATPIGADDLTPGLFTPSLSGGSVALAGQARKSDLSVALAGSTLSVSFWLWFDDVSTDDVFPLDLRYLTGSIIVLQLVRVAGTWQVSAVATGSSVTFTVTALPTRKWTLVTLRMTLPSGLVEFWMDANPPVSGTMSGTPPTSALFEQLSMGDDFAGGFGYLQLYVGSAFTRDQHLAQFTAAYTGLERQTTGDRIRTLAGYAGLDGGALINVDKGCSVMAPARLAGQTIAAAMYEARDTERGDLFVDGGGLLTFHDRRSIYNI